MKQRALVLALGGVVLLLLGLIIGQNLERSRPQESAAAPTTATPPPQPQASLSPTEYWITPPAVDVTRTGVSVWAVLRKGGNLVIETCRGPDYTIPDRPDVPLAIPVARCEVVIDGRISRLDGGALVVDAGNGTVRTFPYALVRESGDERLVLEIGGGVTVTLVAGSKNDLFDRLHRLPADAEVRARYMQRKYEQKR